MILRGWLDECEAVVAGGGGLGYRTVGCMRNRAKEATLWLELHLPFYARDERGKSVQAVAVHVPALSLP